MRALDYANPQYSFTKSSYSNPYYDYTYAVTEDGVLCGSIGTYSNSVLLYINDSQIGNNINTYQIIFIPVSKGDIIHYRSTSPVEDKLHIFNYI